MDKRWIIITLVVVFLAVFFYRERQALKPPTHQQPSECDSSLWDHVYNPARLKVLQTCLTVSGTIESLKKEPDGDFHIRLKLDPQYNNLLNDKNLSGQRGDLVLEPVCEHPVTQEDAISACQNFLGQITVPPSGTHVFVTGSFVLDTDHGWNEIHPVSKMAIQ